MPPLAPQFWVAWGGICGAWFIGRTAERVSSNRAVKKAASIETYDKQFFAVSGSFRQLSGLSNKQKALAEPLKISIMVANADTTYAELVKQSPLDQVSEVQLRLFNQQYPTGQPRPGQLIKIVK